jgi:hypothetical protein
MTWQTPGEDTTRTKGYAKALLHGLEHLGDQPVRKVSVVTLQSEAGGVLTDLPDDCNLQALCWYVIWHCTSLVQQLTAVKGYDLEIWDGYVRFVSSSSWARETVRLTSHPDTASTPS